MEGQVCSASMAVLRGKDVTGYLHTAPDGKISLHYRNGRLWLDHRGRIAVRYLKRPDGLQPVAVLFNLNRGRFVIGYALDANRYLFRGRLIDGVSFTEAFRETLRLAEYWIGRDEDALRILREQANPTSTL